MSQLLNDDGLCKQLNCLRVHTQNTIDEFKRNKDLLESNLDSKLKTIERQRAELDRLQEMAVEDMLKENKEYQRLAGRNLQQAVECVETLQQSQAPAEMDTNCQAQSEADIDYMSVNEVHADMVES